MPLAPGTVQIWRTRLDVSDTTELTCERLLTPQEIERAAAFTFPAGRRRFIVARAVLRLLLGQIVEREAGDLRFDATRLGKPRLVMDGAPEFSVSHSHDLAAFAFGSQPVGVDVEHVRPMPDALALARRFFSPPELARIEAAPPGGAAAAFYHCWTRKEACIKATGEGLSADLRPFDVMTDPDRVLMLGEPAVTPGASCLFLRSLTLPVGYVGALATHGVADVQEFEWPLAGGDESRRMFAGESR